MSDKTKKENKKRRRIKTSKLVFLVLAVYIVIVAGITFVLDGRHVLFVIPDEADPVLEYGESWSDEDMFAVTSGSIFGEGSKRLPISREGAPDLSHVGSYELRYTARWLFRDYYTTRTVTVRDTVPPVLTLNTVEGYSAGWLSGYEEEGYTAVDNCDGDITANVTVSVADGVYTYTVSDSSGNSVSAERRPFENLQEPEILLNGLTEETINACMSYTDPGFSAVDQFGNDVSDMVQVSGSVTSWLPGTYNITYTLENSTGDSVSVVRTVNVLSLMNDNIDNPPSGTIYLTFDDGPGPYTEWLLNVLDKYNVKATFFVTNQFPDYSWLIGREAQLGHAVAVHSYWHDYGTIYSSEAAFFEDFNAMQDVIQAQTGSRASIFRFPGGSSNTVSNFNPGIMSRLAAAMENMGYRYFDWNVVSGDAGETKDTATIVENIIGGCTGCRYAVVLQHDIHDYSVAAVEQVICWGLANGYRFDVLSSDSPVCHHGINN